MTIVAVLGARGRRHIRELGALGASLGLHVVVILAIAFMTLSPPREPPSVVVELLYEEQPAATEGQVALHPEPAQQQAQAVPEVRPSDPEPEAVPPTAESPQPPVPQPETAFTPPEPELADLPPESLPEPEPEPEPALALEPAPRPPQTKPRPERAAPRPAPVVAPERTSPADALAAAPVAQAPPAAVAATPAAPPSMAAPVPAPAQSPPSVSYGSVLLRWLERYREYPRTARLRRIEGVVVLRLTIERSGRLAEATVSESSGSPILDEAALEMARRAAPLPPLPQGEAVERVVMLVPIAFRLT